MHVAADRGGPPGSAVVLREQVEALAAQVAGLRARLGTNPRNSSKPPFWEGLARPAPRSLRNKSGRKQGQPRATLAMTGWRDEVVTHEPGRCAGCRPSLRADGLATAVKRDGQGSNS